VLTPPYTRLRSIAELLKQSYAKLNCFLPQAHDIPYPVSAPLSPTPVLPISMPSKVVRATSHLLSSDTVCLSLVKVRRSPDVVTLPHTSIGPAHVFEMSRLSQKPLWIDFPLESVCLIPPLPFPLTYLKHFEMVLSFPHFAFLVLCVNSPLTMRRPRAPVLQPQHQPTLNKSLFFPLLRFCLRPLVTCTFL